jgi:hypothetical protein
MYSKSIKVGLLVALMLFGCAAASHAQETQITPEKRALIQELLELTGGAKGVNGMLDIMLQQQEKDLPKLLGQLISNNKNLTPEERAASEQKLKEVSLRAIRRMKEAFQKINYVQVVEDISAASFDKYFNESELKEWIAFYKSPLGKKTIELMPTIYAESMQKISNVLLPLFQEEINKVIADEMEQLEQELKPATSPPPGTKKKS